MRPPLRVREGDEEPVAGVVDLLAAVLREKPAECPVVPADEVLPGGVADGLDERRRVADVGEEEDAHGALRVGAGEAAEQVADTTDVPRRSEPLEGRERSGELELRAVLVAVARVGLGDQDPGPRRLVGSLDLVEELHRPAQPGARRLDVALGERHGAQ
jgi:hypothetical protein